MPLSTINMTTEKYSNQSSSSSVNNSTAMVLYERPEEFHLLSSISKLIIMCIACFLNFTMHNIFHLPNEPEDLLRHIVLETHMAVYTYMVYLVLLIVHLFMKFVYKI